MARRFAGVIVASAVAFALAACGAGDSEGVEESDPPRVADEPGLGVDDFPDDASQIDESLVQDVIDTLDPYVERFFSNAAAGEYGEEVHHELSIVYTEPALGQRLGQIRDPDFAALLSDEPGEILSEVQELRITEVECVDAVVVRDMSDVNPATGPGEEWVVTLVPAPDTANGTAWQIARELPPESSPEGARDDGCSDLLP